MGPLLAPNCLQVSRITDEHRKSVPEFLLGELAGFLDETVAPIARRNVHEDNITG